MRLKHLPVYIFILSIFLLSACIEENTQGMHSPSLFFSKQAGFVYKDTTVKAGTKLKVGIYSSYNGYDLLSNFEIIRKSADNDKELLENIVVDNKYYDVEKTIEKTDYAFDTYYFMITDFGGRTNTDSLCLSLPAGEDSTSTE